MPSTAVSTLKCRQLRLLGWRPVPYVPEGAGVQPPPAKRDGGLDFDTGEMKRGLIQVGNGIYVEQVAIFDHSTISLIIEHLKTTSVQKVESFSC